MNLTVVGTGRIVESLFRSKQNYECMRGGIPKNVWNVYWQVYPCDIYDVTVNRILA